MDKVNFKSDPPRQGEPNWYWQKLGYSVEVKYTQEGSIRIIRRPDSTIVDIVKKDGESNREAEIRVGSELCQSE